MILRELTAMDVSMSRRKGCPGIVGRDGWLACSEWTRGHWICTISGPTMAVRLDVHFWWNILNMTPLILACHSTREVRPRPGSSKPKRLTCAVTIQAQLKRSNKGTRRTRDQKIR